MGKTNRKGRSKTTFIMVRHDIFESAAYRSLSSTARATHLEVMRRYNGYNNGEIPLSCREAAERCNFSKGTAKRTFDELINAGFIKIGQDAAFNMKKRYARRWILTHESYNGRGPSNEWRERSNELEKNSTVSRQAHIVPAMELVETIFQ